MMLLQDEALVDGVKHWITGTPLQRRMGTATQLEISQRANSTRWKTKMRVNTKADLEQIVASRRTRHEEG